MRGVRVWGLAVVVFVSLVFGMIFAAQAQTFNFKMATFYVAGDPAFDVANHFAKLVKEKTGGKVNIEVFQAGELGFPVVEILEATSRGVIETAIFYTSYKAAQDAVMALAGGRPGPVFNFDEQVKYVKAVEDIVASAFKRFGVTYIGPIVYGEPEILVSTKPLTGIKDIKGRIFRASGMAAEFYKALGAQAVMLPAGELYQALQLGTIDGLEWTDFTANYKLGFYEVAKHVLEPTKGVNLHSEAAVHAFLVFNPAVWDKLPKEYQEIVKSSCAEAYKWGGEFIANLNKEYRQKWIDAGAKVVQLPQEDLDQIISVGAKLIASYAAKSPDAKDFCLKLIPLWKELGYERWSKALEGELK